MFVGQPAPGRVTVIVSLATLLGEERGVGKIAGYGFIYGRPRRQLATARRSASAARSSPTRSRAPRST